MTLTYDYEDIDNELVMQFEVDYIAQTDAHGAFETFVVDGPVTCVYLEFMGNMFINQAFQWVKIPFDKLPLAVQRGIDEQLEELAG